MEKKITYYNGSYTEKVNSDLITNRGFIYGDGLFETILSKSGVIQHLAYHFDRLNKGLRILNIDFNTNGLENILIELLNRNFLITTNARVKIIVFRNSGGLYTPTNNSSSIIITAAKYTKPNNYISSLGVSKNIKLPKSPLGNLKTISSLPYIIASMEKDASEHDELVILNTNNEVCECTSSNIFWRKQNSYFTPSLETGCIEGIMRRVIISNLKQESIQINEGIYSLDDIANSDEIFITNVTGRKNVIRFSH